MLNWGFPLLVCLGLSCLPYAWSQQYTITTVAGNGSSGFSDGSDAKAAQFSSPNAIAVDSKGVLYVADTGNHRVRSISGGTVATVAGTGTAGFSGNGGAATAATLNSPGAVAVDSSGAIYIADTANHVVRKVSGSNITPFAGNGNAGFDDGQSAVTGNLNSPNGLALDSEGNLYIADTGNSLIRKVDTKGIMTTYLGGTNNNPGRLKSPTRIWMDAAGALYIADSGNQRLVKYAGGVFTVIAGNGSAGFSGDGGAATRAMLNNPVGVAVDAAGNVYVADVNNSRIRKMTTDGNIFTIAGKGGASYTGDNGPATSAGLAFPRGVAVDSGGKVYIADTQNHVIRALTATLPAITPGGVVNAASFTARLSPGALATVFGSGFGSGPAVQPDAPLPTTVNGIRVTVNGTPAPIFYLSPGQINFQVPWGTASGSGTVLVSVNGGNSNAVSVPVTAAATGLFFYVTSGAAIVQNSDYSLNDPSNPAARGSTIIAYLTGSGPVSPAQSDGVPATAIPLVNMTSPYSARIGSADAAVSFAGLAPGFIGLVQMNIVVPSSLAPGVYPLMVTVGGETSNAATIAVK